MACRRVSARPPRGASSAADARLALRVEWWGARARAGDRKRATEQGECRSIRWSKGRRNFLRRKNMTPRYLSASHMPGRVRESFARPPRPIRAVFASSVIGRPLDVPSRPVARGWRKYATRVKPSELALTHWEAEAASKSRSCARETLFRRRLPRAAFPQPRPEAAKKRSTHKGAAR